MLIITNTPPLVSSVNKNTCPGDKSALRPGGLRLGTPALTSRAFKEDDFAKVADFIDKALKMGLEIMKESGPNVNDFTKVMENNEDFKKRIESLRSEVEEFSAKYPMPGYTDY